MKTILFLMFLFLFSSVPGSAQSGPENGGRQSKSPCQIWIYDNILLGEHLEFPSLKSILVKTASGEFAYVTGDSYRLDTAAGLCLNYFRIQDLGQDAFESSTHAPTLGMILGLRSKHMYAVLLQAGASAAQDSDGRNLRPYSIDLLKIYYRTVKANCASFEKIGLSKPAACPQTDPAQLKSDPWVAAPGQFFAWDLATFFTDLEPNEKNCGILTDEQCRNEIKAGVCAELAKQSGDSPDSDYKALVGDALKEPILGCSNHAAASSKISPDLNASKMDAILEKVQAEAGL